MMVSLFPFLAGQMETQNQEVGPGGLGSNRDSASGKGIRSPFAGILQHQAAAASLLSFQPLTTASGNQQHLPDLQKPLHQQELAGDVIPQQSLATMLVSEGKMLNLPEEKSLPASFPLIGEGGERVVGDEDFPLELSGSLPLHYASKEQQLPGENLPQAMVAGTSGGKDIYNPPVFKPFDQSFFSNRASVPGPPAETKMPDAGLMPSVAYPDRQFHALDIVKGQSSVTGSLDGEPSPESSADTGRNGAINLERTIRPLPDLETLLPRIAPSLAKDSGGNLRSFNQQAFQTPLPMQESPAGMAEVAALDQYRIKPPTSLSSFFSIPSEQGKTSSVPLSSDLLRESFPSLTGEHTKNFSEATGKMMGVEQQAGQGLNTGLGGSPHSQNGFQQPSTHLPSGTGVRMAEDPMTEFPTPALQRLQLDVQLSETNRIHIDVGVQHRQVYAGLVMDQASLKNLAVQFVPQLEDQLAQADMELQEFSAEVRDYHREQEMDSNLFLSEKRPGHREVTGQPHTPDIHSRIVRGMDERGLHLVA